MSKGKPFYRQWGKLFYPHSIPFFLNLTLLFLSLFFPFSPFFSTRFAECINRKNRVWNTKKNMKEGDKHRFYAGLLVHLELLVHLSYKGFQAQKKTLQMQITLQMLGLIFSQFSSFNLFPFTLKSFALQVRIGDKRGQIGITGVTGQTFLSSMGQIFLSSSIPFFLPIDPPFSISFSPNISPVFSFTGQPFMRLTECNLEIKRLLFSPFISGYFDFEGG